MTTYTASQFDKAVEIIGQLPKDGPVKPTQDEQLIFYGLFKQAKEGDNTKPKPGMMDFSGKYKWEAWNKVKGLDTATAQSNYVEAFFTVLDKSGTPEGAKHKETILAA